MKLSLCFILCFVILSSCQSFNKNQNSRSQNSRVEKTTLASKTNSNKVSDKQWLSRASIYQELTGQKIDSQQAGQKLIKMAELAQVEKNYILALKRYNTVIARFSNSKLAQAAYFGKADLYKKMGLAQQSQYNLRVAREYKITNKDKDKVKVAVVKNLVVEKPVMAKKTVSVRKTASSQKTGTKK